MKERFFSHSRLTSGDVTPVSPVAPAAGLPVRTNLRAGLAWDELDDKAADLWSQFTGAISSAVGGDSAES